MAEHVLVPMDESEQSRAALEYALAKYPDASITVLHVIEPHDFRTYGGVEGWIDYEQVAEQRRHDAERVLEEVQVEEVQVGADELISPLRRRSRSEQLRE